MQTKTMHHYIMPCLQQNLQKEIHPEATIKKLKKIKKITSRMKGLSVSHQALVSVQPFPAEELAETAVKIRKRRLLTESE